MVKLGALALGLLSVVAEVSAQKTVNIMPFGASIVSVSLSLTTHAIFTNIPLEMLARKPSDQTPR
jgi:hypothetical protein